MTSAIVRRKHHFGLNGCALSVGRWRMESSTRAFCYRPSVLRWEMFWESSVKWPLHYFMVSIFVRFFSSFCRIVVWVFISYEGILGVRVFVFIFSFLFFIFFRSGFQILLLFENHRVRVFGFIFFFFFCMLVGVFSYSMYEVFLLIYLKNKSKKTLVTDSSFLFLYTWSYIYYYY